MSRVQQRTKTGENGAEQFAPGMGMRRPMQTERLLPPLEEKQPELLHTSPAGPGAPPYAAPPPMRAGPQPPPAPAQAVALPPQHQTMPIVEHRQPQYVPQPQPLQPLQPQPMQLPMQPQPQPQLQPQPQPQPMVGQVGWAPGYQGGPTVRYQPGGPPMVGFPAPSYPTTGPAMPPMNLPGAVLRQDAPSPSAPFRAPELASVIGGLTARESEVFDKLAFFCRAEEMDPPLTLREVHEVMKRVFG